MIHPTLRCTAFAGPRRIASGELRHVALKAKQAFDAGKPVLVFEDASGQPVELPLELPAGELLRRLAEPAAEADTKPAAEVEPKPAAEDQAPDESKDGKKKDAGAVGEKAVAVGKADPDAADEIPRLEKQIAEWKSGK